MAWPKTMVIKFKFQFKHLCKTVRNIIVVFLRIYHFKLENGDYTDYVLHRLDDRFAVVDVVVRDESWHMDFCPRKHFAMESFEADVNFKD